MAFCDIKEAEVKRVQPGVEERTLISPEKTPSKRISVKHITIETDRKMGPQEAAEEMIYFVISGRGVLTIDKVKAEWKSPIESNAAIWIPYSVKHTIANSGEESLRCLVFSTRLDQKRAGWTEILDQAPTVRETPFTSTHGGGYRFFGGAETTMNERGAERFTLCGIATMASGTLLVPHTPALGAEEIMYVVQGKGKMTSGGREFQVKPGSIVYAPPNTMHSVQNTCKDVLQFVYCECLP